METAEAVLEGHEQEVRLRGGQVDFDHVHVGGVDQQEDRGHAGQQPEVGQDGTAVV